MVSVLSSSVIDRGFISDVMVSVLSSSVVDRGFISDVMVSVLTSSVVDRGFELQSVQIKDYQKWYLLLLHSKVRNIKENEQRLVGSESG
jgi:hypothetical protein